MRVNLLKLEYRWQGNIRPKFSACVQGEWDWGWDPLSQWSHFLLFSQVKQIFYRSTDKERMTCLYTPVLPFEQHFSEIVNFLNTGENQSHLEAEIIS